MYKPMPYLCMGISRLFGGIAFLAASYEMFDMLNNKWHLGVKHLMELSSAGGKAYGALTISMIVGLVALVIGQGIGASIRVKNENLACQITITWHYLANTSIIWFLMAPSVTVITMGKAQSKVFFMTFGDDFFIVTLIIAAIGGILISLSLTLSGWITAHRNQLLGMLLSRLLPIIIGITMGIFQFSGFGLPIFGGVIIGFVLPHVLIPICASMWRKDMIRRNPTYIDM